MMPAETLKATHPGAAQDGRLVVLGAPGSAAAGQYRILHQRVMQLASRRPLRVVAVTSAARGEGRTTTAANLALIAAQEGRTALLVEADLRRPALAALFGLAPRAGLAEVLEGTAELAQAIVRVGPLAVLCAGEARDGDAARRPRAAAVMEQLRAAYDLIVLDAPPALAFADGDRLAAAADAALLVVRAGSTPRQVVRFALESLGERAAGIVLNDVDVDSVAHGRWIYAAGPDARTA
jgi:capsular exopolysaccharide synthesis family protein